MPDATSPEHIPLARPVSVEHAEDIVLSQSANQSTPSWPAPMSRLRAVVELLVLLACGVAGIFATYFLSKKISVPDPRWHQVISTAAVGMILVLASFVIVRVAGQRPNAIGWTRKDLAANIGIGLGAWAVTCAMLSCVVVAMSLVFPHMLDDTPEAQKAIEQTFPPMRLYGIVLLTIFVAFWEEIVFRGFVLTRLNAIFKRWWLTILLASSVFGAIHIYEGLLAVMMISILALVMSTLFVWRRSLAPSIMFHFLHNLFMFVLLDVISQTWK